MSDRASSAVPSTPASTYAGRSIWLTTLHGKERALARPLAWGLGASLRVCASDTNRLGTFSGDVERPADPLTTCRRKAELGLEATGASLGLASEGSFGPHPAIPFLPVGQEVLVFIDRERQLTVVEQHLELRTTFASRTLQGDGLNSVELQHWLELVRFPSHALIVRPAPESEASGHSGPCFKGISSPQELHDAVLRCASHRGDGQVLLESDMRAHCNPTRMASIRRLGIVLVRRLRQHCPACGSPGWGRGKLIKGLPCCDCGTPTALVAAEQWQCPACAHTQHRPRRDGVQQADPLHCPWCNP